MKISTILDSIEMGNVALPEFQRGYVWGRDQVRELMRSLYRRYPVGSLLVWTTEAQSTATRGGAAAPGNVVKLLLDGQQRITSLYGVVRGHPPTFFQGNDAAFTDLYFDLRTETFEFYGPVKMKGDPLWVDVTELFKTELSPWFSRMATLELTAEEQGRYLERLNRVLGVRDIELHIEEITGADKTVDEVVDIFNRVNSGGTKLSKGDLALARICAAWPDAREVMVEAIDAWKEVGFDFKLDWLLRVTNAVLTGEAKFTALANVSPEEFQQALAKSVQLINQLLNLVGSQLGFDHDRVLLGRYGFPVMARYLATNGSKFPSAEDQGKLLFWYLHAGLWGRHSGSTESMLDQDLGALEEGGLDRLIEVLRTWRGELVVRPEQFIGSSIGSRFYPLIYLLTRVHGAKDFGSGNVLSAHLLGKLAGLQLHHIFPKSHLQTVGYPQRERNQLANFCFLTQETNLAVGAKPPSVYFSEVEEAHPGVLATQWIPTDAELWADDRYLDFLAARRELLAEAANAFLSSLYGGTAVPSQSAPQPGTSTVTVATPVVPGDSDGTLQHLIDVAELAGLAAPTIPWEIADDESGELLAWADAAWPNGVQEGLTDPVAFLLEADPEVEARLNELGFRYYTSSVALVRYFEAVTGLDIDGDGIVGPVGDAHDVDAPLAEVVDPVSTVPASDGYGALGPSEAAADERGLGDQFRELIRQCEEAGLAAKPFKTGVMMTPPGKPGRMLVWIKVRSTKSPRLKVSLGWKTASDLYGIAPSVVLEHIPQTVFQFGPDDDVSDVEAAMAALFELIGDHS